MLKCWDAGMLKYWNAGMLELEGNNRVHRQLKGKKLILFLAGSARCFNPDGGTYATALLRRALLYASTSILFFQSVNLSLMFFVFNFDELVKN